MAEDFQTPLPEGQDLLDGLYTVQAYLQQVDNKLTEYWTLERQFRNNIAYLAQKEKVDTSTVSGKTQYAFFYIGVTIAIVLGITSLFGAEISSLLYALAIVGLFCYGKVKNNQKLFKIGAILLAFLILTWARGLINVVNFGIRIHYIGSAILYIVINVIAFAVGLFVCAALLRKHNANIDKQNEEIAEKNRQIELKNNEIARNNALVQQQRQEIAAEINVINAEMLQTTSSWFPPDYYSLEAVDHMIAIVRNHKADTVKEMILTYDTEGYRNAVITNQQETNAKLEQSLNNQQQMIRLQKVANALLMGNLVANLATAANTAETAAYSAQTAANSAQTAANSARTAASAQSIARDADAMARRVGAKW